MKSLWEFILALRDLLIPILPTSIARLLVGKGEFVFLAHPIDLLPDIARKYPISTTFPRWLLKFISRYHWTTILGKIKGFTDQHGNKKDGWILFISLSTRMMVLKEELARKKILQALRFSEKIGAKIIGLGAFVPIVTEDGTYLADKTKMSITTGSSFSAVIAIENILKAADIFKLNKQNIKLSIVGAAGTVGKCCATILSEYFQSINLVDKNEKELISLHLTLSNKYPTSIYSKNTNIQSIKDSDIVLVITNTPGIIVRSYHLKPNAIVIDAAQPRNVSLKVPLERKDVVVIESGIAEVDNIHLTCDIGLAKSNEVYSCLAEILMLLWYGRFETHVGDINIEYARQLLKSAELAGIRVAQFRNITGFLKV